MVSNLGSGYDLWLLGRSNIRIHPHLKSPKLNPMDPIPIQNGDSRNHRLGEGIIVLLEAPTEALVARDPHNAPRFRRRQMRGVAPRWVALVLVSAVGRERFGPQVQNGIREV